MICYKISYKYQSETMVTEEKAIQIEPFGDPAMRKTAASWKLVDVLMWARVKSDCAKLGSGGSRWRPQDQGMSDRLMIIQAAMANGRRCPGCWAGRRASARVVDVGSIDGGARHALGRRGDRTPLGTST